MGVTFGSVVSGAVTRFANFTFFREMPPWVPSQARIFGLYSHQGSISFLKSMFILPIHANIHFTKVSTLINGAANMLFVLYFLVSSLQNPVKDILALLTMLMKSHPISSPAHVSLDRKKIQFCSPLYSS